MHMPVCKILEEPSSGLKCMVQKINIIIKKKNQPNTSRVQRFIIKSCGKANRSIWQRNFNRSTRKPLACQSLLVGNEGPMQQLGTLHAKTLPNAVGLFRKPEAFFTGNLKNKNKSKTEADIKSYGFLNRSYKKINWYKSQDDTSPANYGQLCWL